MSPQEAAKILVECADDLAALACELTRHAEWSTARPAAPWEKGFDALAIAQGILKLAAPDATTGTPG